MSTASIGTKKRQRRQPKQEREKQQPQQNPNQSSPSHYNETPRVAGSGFSYPPANVNGGAGIPSYSHLQERKPSASYVPTSSNPADAERLQQGQKFKIEPQHGHHPPVYHQYPPQPAYLSQDIFHPSQQQQQQPSRPGMVSHPSQPHPGQDPNYPPGAGPNADPQRQGQPPQQWTPYPPNPNPRYYPPQAQPSSVQGDDGQVVRVKKKPGRKPRAKEDLTAGHPYGSSQPSGNNSAPPTITHPSPGSIPLPYQQGTHIPPAGPTQTKTPTSASPRPFASGKVTRRSRMGCLTCRQRKKRCCESRPKCTECGRLGLNCVWPKPGTEHKNKPKDQKEDENTMEHEIYGRIKVLRGIVEYRSE
ncbi:CZF1 [Candida theae]|uniref:CZF1 n=1 Tax=Candida theae TaxID=1198502 RepID=A0AAD5FYV9_9ASCO|nr:CZF1 [Candida theae]KAI5958643.1 CZF1 [Candida theae]